MKIKAVSVHPPIPVRDFDWFAYDDDTYDGDPESNPVIGWGKTAELAIADFKEHWEWKHDKSFPESTAVLAEAD